MLDKKAFYLLSPQGGLGLLLVRELAVHSACKSDDWKKHLQNCQESQIAFWFCLLAMVSNLNSFRRRSSELEVLFGGKLDEVESKERP